MAIYSGFSHWKWWFSIVMLVYQRVLFPLPYLFLVNCSASAAKFRTFIRPRMPPLGPAEVSPWLCHRWDGKTWQNLWSSVRKKTDESPKGMCSDSMILRIWTYVFSGVCVKTLEYSIQFGVLVQHRMDRKTWVEKPTPQLDHETVNCSCPSDLLKCQNQVVCGSILFVLAQGIARDCWVHCHWATPYIPCCLGHQCTTHFH